MPLLGEIKALPIGCRTAEEALRMKAYYFDVMDYTYDHDNLDPDPQGRGIVKRFHQSDARIRIMTAPARTSKSFSAAPEVVAMAMPTSPATHSLQWIIGVDYPTNKEFQYVWKYLVEEKDRWGGVKITQAVNNPSNGNMRIVMETGFDEQNRVTRAIIEGKSSSNERALQGEHVTQAVLSEAAEHDQKIWTKYLSTRVYKAILPTTPKPSGEWIRDLGDAGAEDPSLSIESFNFSRYANPLYDHDIYTREEKLAANRTDSGIASEDYYFAEQFLGRWVYYTGRVLPFEPSRHVLDVNADWIDECDVYVSTDYGWEDACVALFWAQHSSGALLIFDEIYSNHLTTEEFVGQIVDKLDAWGVTSRYVCGDPKQPQVAEYLQRQGLNVVNVNKRYQSDRALGHRRLVDLLSMRTNRNEVMFSVGSNCRRVINEWKSLHYREGVRNEYGAAALKGADHAFDAARYFVTTLPEPRKEAPPEDWMRRHQRELRESRFSANTFAATLGVGRWAAGGGSPYAGR